MNDFAEQNSYHVDAVDIAEAEEIIERLEAAHA